ncbi:MAG: tyrosine--tRNA ligase [Patescibacteria group bacterium]|nr:tyrosine--tRNA ligase [Patescibacteria group bacterium]
MDKVGELLSRGVETIYPSKEELEKVLRSGKKLRIYEGFDPTSPQLHIGHLVSLRKLRQWQDLGHEVIFLIGDFTGMIGDPTGKDKTRIPLTKEQVKENAKTYKDQASKILRFDGENPVTIRYNSEWLEKMSITELAELMRYLSVQQIIERDMFQRRLKNNMDIAISEFLYPLMQGYDSVAMEIDVEVGGNDQLFNMMIGRDLLHRIKRKNKFVMTTPILEDSMGVKIGKTEGNAIAISDSPNDLYAKLMALGDDVIVKGFTYLTDIPMDEIQNIEKEIEKGNHPMIYKKKLAFEIVKGLNSDEEAKNAQENFERTVQQKEVPSDIIELPVEDNYTVAEVLIAGDFVESKSEAKRLIEQGGVELNDKRITDPNTKAEEGILRVGKRKFVKIKFNN